MSEWDRYTVNDIKANSKSALATGPFGSSISSKYFVESGVPVIRGKNLSESIGIRLSDDEVVFVSEEKAKIFERSIARKGDLVFTCWGTIGQVGLIDNRAKYEEYVVSNKQMKLTPNPEMASSLFLYYLFSSNAMVDLIQSSGIGSSVPGFNLGQLRELSISLPPLPEQRAIASVLGALDDKIELNRRMNKTLEDMAAAIFKAWFVDFEPVHAKAGGAKSFSGMPQDVFDALPSGFVDSEIGQIPEGWEVGSLSDCVDILSGGTPKRANESFWGGEHAWYSVKDAPSDGNVWVVDTSEKITTEGLDGSAASLLPIGTTIISARGTVGKLALTSIPMAMNQSCYGLAGNGQWGVYFTYWTSRQAVLELKQKTHGSVFDTITRDTFKKVDVICPSTSVHLGFENAVESIMNLMMTNLLESNTLAETRDTLLPMLLSGEVRIPTDDIAPTHEDQDNQWRMPTRDALLEIARLADPLEHEPVAELASGDPSDGGPITMPIMIYGETIEKLVKLAYEHDLVESFDWTEWQSQAEELINDPAKLAGADLVTVQRLMTLHVRNDRFCEGHLSGMHASGHLVALLRRIGEIAEGM